ncbi:alpha-glucan family phosphorylase [Alloacidobacterium dinghuense]|uniref:Alpha-glucan family phosphorylase n=1 Tax=Alloacidobacterium dinghuense TaxID=2763107 RepID=A0A7G8BCQ8_9BACT|nr:alpha-glucan family phosphorylase [Alloacidobacterium dinghuense]QNI30328.1 alpha-glucan family phosphorylase [Alloacidobacterium dinghuense]
MSQAAESLDASRVLTLEEISQLMEESSQPADTLMRVVVLIARYSKTDVCSIYLLEPDRANLVLAATVGLTPMCVGTLRLAMHEGLAGLVAEQVRPIAVKHAKSHPRFKYIKEACEDAFQSFLGVPLIDRGVLQGVLVVQTIEPRDFHEDEIRILADAAMQVAPTVSEARTLARFIAPMQERLWSLARNIWWSWDQESCDLFLDLDPRRWRDLNHNPVALLNEMPLAKIEQRAAEMVLHSRINYAYRRMREYTHADRTWGAIHAGILRPRPVAYFSAEFGLHESLPIYSGGLGVLAGDHIKSASDLDIPLIGIGLFYGQGYFRQSLDQKGWQQEEYLDTDTNQLPMEPAIGVDGKAVTIEIATRKKPILAKVWRVKVGRCNLFLLDSNIEGNAPEDRELTSRLYGGDGRVRIRQELLLGVGGFRALKAMGITPGVLHLNEGHSGFVILEAIRTRMREEGMTFAVAASRVSREVVFTTHTPVPAGHDRFDAALIEEHLGPMADELGLSAEQLMGMGREHPSDTKETFCMTVLGLKHARRANAVSALHGEASRQMWTGLYPGKAEDDVPIGHITNGVHVHSWLAPQMARLYDRHLGSGWQERSGRAHTWEGIEGVDDGELWETHVGLKLRLLEFVRQRAMEQATRREEPSDTVLKLGRVLSPDALTIGFARRFATYKRANLILADIEKLTGMVNDPKRPVQFVFAGKAHPHDEPGKRVLQQIADLMYDSVFADRFVFVEDYDINVGRHFVQGVDVWLNNPRRPLEASGTSGQKVVLNGGLNLSILDGWWAEAYDGLNGFAIGKGTTHSQMDVHDNRDSEDLYRVLREEVVPLYYQRDSDGLPRGWIKRMKRTIRTLGWRFNADRMVMDYTTKCYVPAAGGTSSDMRGR